MFFLFFCFLLRKDALTYALVHNRSEFIDFILKRGVKIKSYLTNDKLKELYNDTLESKVWIGFSVFPEKM